jgi:hypothetical protein
MRKFGVRGKQLFSESKWLTGKFFLPMTPRQSLALSSVLTNPDNTEGLASFAKTIVNDAGRFGTILTVDRFDDHLTWHVSVSALSDQFKPMLWERLKPSQREAVSQLARELSRTWAGPIPMSKTFKTRATRSFVDSQSRKKESLDEELVQCRLCL